MSNEHVFGTMDFDHAARLLVHASILAIGNRVITQEIDKLSCTPEQMTSLLSRVHLLEAVLEEEMKTVLERTLQRFSFPLIPGNSSDQVHLLGLEGMNQRDSKEQICLLTTAFPVLEPVFANLNHCIFRQIPSPSPLYSYQILPHWSLIADSYRQASVLVLETLLETRPNAFENCLQPGDLDLLEETLYKTDSWNRVMKTSRGKCVFLPIQPGLKYAQHPPNLVISSMSDMDMPLGIYEVGMMLITYGDMLVSEKSLWIDCPGDALNENVSTSMVRCPIFDWHQGRLRIRTRYIDELNPKSGSATGYIYSPS